MRLLWLILSLTLVMACSSSPSSQASSDASDQDESPYARSLPATDMGASRIEATVSSVDAGASNASSTQQPGYTREFVLEEEVIASATGEIENYDSSVPLPPPSTSGQIDIANTFTLQLAAVSSMDIAIEYAQQYGIDPAAAGVARILSQGQIYYVLAYGVYQSYEEAEKASLEIQALGVPEPWIRRLSALEKLSNEANASGL